MHRGLPDIVDHPSRVRFPAVRQSYLRNGIATNRAKRGGGHAEPPGTLVLARVGHSGSLVGGASGLAMLAFIDGGNADPIGRSAVGSRSSGQIACSCRPVHPCRQSCMPRSITRRLPGTLLNASTIRRASFHGCSIWTQPKAFSVHSSGRLRSEVGMMQVRHKESLKAAQSA